MADRLRVSELPRLEQHQLDLIGLGLVALAAFFAFVFYFGWDGGKVGDGVAEAFRWLFGGVAYLRRSRCSPSGALLVMRPLLPTVRPFKAGGICLLTALMLGLAAGTFGLGPDDPPRDGFARPDFFRSTAAWSARASSGSRHAVLDGRRAPHLRVPDVVGVMLLTGASIAGVISATREASPLPPSACGRTDSAEGAHPWSRCRPIAPPEPEVPEPVVGRPTSRRRRSRPSATASRVDGSPSPSLEPEPERGAETPSRSGVRPGAEPTSEPRAHADGQQAHAGHRGRRHRLHAAEPSVLKRSNGAQKADPAPRRASARSSSRRSATSTSRRRSSGPSPART